jgi:hypothetical protein
MGAQASKDCYAPTTSDEDVSVASNFECSVCCEHYSEAEGIETCSKHFYYNDCAIEVLHRSMKNTMDEFPPSCYALTQKFGIPMPASKHPVDIDFRTR